MTSDVKLSYYFLLIKVKQKRVQSTAYSVNAAKLLRLNNVTANCFYFSLNVLKFELQYEWTPPQIFFSVDITLYNYLVVFTTMQREPMISSVVKNSWNWNSADFRELVLILLQAATECVLCKKVFLKSFAIFTGKHLCQSLFVSCNFIKKDTLAQAFFCEFCKIFKRSIFTEHIWMTASILRQLLALYFAIKYSWQFSSREKSLVGK